MQGRRGGVIERTAGKWRGLEGTESIREGNEIYTGLYGGWIAVSDGS